MDAHKREVLKQAAEETEQTPKCIECGELLDDEMAAAGLDTCMDCLLDPPDDAPEAQPLQVNLPEMQGRTKAQQLAGHILSPALQAGMTACLWDKVLCADLDVLTMTQEIEAQTAELSKNDSLARCEAMLMAQAHTLDAVANNLLRRAQGAQLMPQLETYAHLGLKAQAQCRATVSALADLKRPRQTAFVKQANIAHGPQQVNNGTADANDERGATAGSGRSMDGGQKSLASVPVQGMAAVDISSFTRAEPCKRTS